ncbi:MAG TPA: AgmX/PglI C-terminal domain-containing protein [Kofleriaceae bacterium]|nr:AgmX/PglI C-terminal domain-containing protein [Kofleriaceae bacterium]
MTAKIWLFGLVLAACAHARTADEYRDATRAALATRAGDIKACYDHVLTTKPTAMGKVTVKFAIEEKTGRIVDVKVDGAQTTAPDDVSQCVVAAMPAVAIQPGDRKRGEGTWSWDFTASAAPAPAADR